MKVYRDGIVLLDPAGDWYPGWGVVPNHIHFIK